MENNVILDHGRIQRIVERLAHQIMEEIHHEEEIVLAGVYPNGNLLADRLKKHIESRISCRVLQAEVKLDKSNPLGNPVEIISTTDLKDKIIILADDVMNSGKTTAFAISKLLESGAKKIKTVVLVERNHKDFPIKADFVGYSLSTNLHDHVNVEFGVEDKAVLS
jgi:pyrimidine operon attenuation protein / uracil phosphoribosyltransferase